LNLLQNEQFGVLRVSFTPLPANLDEAGGFEITG